MNIEILVEWATNMLCLLDNPEEIKDVSASLFEEHLSWLREYREAIKHYGRLVEITTLARYLASVRF